MLLDLARGIEEESILDAISTRAAPGLLGSDSIRSEEECTRIPFGQQHATPSRLLRRYPSGYNVYHSYRDFNDYSACMTSACVVDYLDYSARLLLMPLTHR
jgi:hypothetical protein